MEVLDLKQVAREDDFFDLRGHSLRAIQLGLRVQDAFAVELPVHSGFERSTLAVLAEEIAQRQLEREAPQEIAQLLEMLEHISDEEARKLLDVVTQGRP